MFLFLVLLLYVLSLPFATKRVSLGDVFIVAFCALIELGLELLVLCLLKYLVS